MRIALEARSKLSVGDGCFGGLAIELRSGLDITKGRGARRHPDAQATDRGRRARVRLADTPRSMEPALPQAATRPGHATARARRLGLEMAGLLPRLAHFARRYTHCADEADDVVQAACERALGRLDQFKDGTRLDSWMYRIVQTICIDRARSPFARRQSGESDTMANVAVDARIYEQVEANDCLDRLRKAIPALPHDQRLVLALVVTEDMTYQEVADHLGVPVGTVMSRLSRARRRLKQVLGD